MKTFPFADRYDWINKKQIGKGSFGKVYKAKNKKSGQYVAIKQISMKMFTCDLMRQTLNNQILVMKDIKHPNIVELIDVSVGQKNTYIILQLCQYDLRKLMRQNGNKLGEQLATQIFQQMMNGFKVLVNNNYVHRDIKPENALMKEGICKLADFGFASKADFEGKQKLQAICGTPNYMAPQVLQQQPYTPKCDIWSIGMTLYQLIYGYTPWPCRSPQTLLENIKTKPLRFPFKKGCQIGQNTKDFIKKCLKISEQQRIGWKQIFEHPLIKKNQIGQTIQPQINFDNQCQQVLFRMQKRIDSAGIDIFQIFKNEDISGVGQLNFFDFYRLCNRIDPKITVKQTKKLFIQADISKDGLISFKQFKDIFQNFDFRDGLDITGRIITDIKQIIKVHQLNVIELFKKFDQDGSGYLDKTQLANLIKAIAPNMPDYDIEMIFMKFDSDGNGQITLDQIKQALTSQLQKLNAQPNYQKCIRMMRDLKRITNKYKVGIAEVIRLFDKDGDGNISLGQLKNILCALNPQTTSQDVETIFKLTDIDENGQITPQQFQRIIQKV